MVKFWHRKDLWRRFYRGVWQLTGIAFGCALMAAGLVMFLIPNKIAAGGVSGLGVILFHRFRVPVGLTIFVSNIPLFILSWRVLGFRFILNSLSGTVLLSILVEALAFLPVVTWDPLLASIYGGIIVGLGLGLVFRFQSSTGGTDMAAQIISHRYGFTHGQSFLGIDFLIIALGGIVFGPELALYALLSLFVTGRVIDYVQEGFSLAKAALIISDHSEAICSEILQTLNRGATKLKGAGAYTGRERGITLVVLTQSEVTRLKNLVREIDPKAFVIVTNTAEVLGEGFREFT